MKKIFIIFIGLIVLGIAGYFIYQYFANPRVISSTSELIAFCTDPDGNNIFKKGTTTYSYAGENSNRTIEDGCDYSDKRANSKVGILRETYCLNKYLITDKINCGMGSVCRNGVCTKGSRTLSICSDSDGGIYSKTKGEINTGVTAQDTCWISSDKMNPENEGGFSGDCSGPNCYLYEYYCENDSRNHQIISSPNGCLDGIQK